MAKKQQKSRQDAPQLDISAPASMRRAGKWTALLLTCFLAALVGDEGYIPYSEEKDNEPRSITDRLYRIEERVRCLARVVFIIALYTSRLGRRNTIAIIGLLRSAEVIARDSYCRACAREIRDTSAAIERSSLAGGSSI